MDTAIRHRSAQRPERITSGRRAVPRWLALTWALFAVGALLALDWVALSTWGWAVPAAAVVLAGVSAATARFPLARMDVDHIDLAVIAGLYVVVVALFRLAFVGFTEESVLGLFLAFATGLLVGVAGPVMYTVWGRRRPLRSLGLGLHRWRATVALAVLFATVQFTMTLWGYALPAPVDWVPLLVMSLAVGLFEAVFFRGFVQMRLEASFGAVAGVAGGAVLYALYHVGYGMPADELQFLFGLGVVYAIVYRLVENVLVLWPLLTPIGALFNSLQAGDIELPWASIAGFADVLAVMAVVILLAHRHQRRASQTDRLPGG